MCQFWIKLLRFLDFFQTPRGCDTLGLLWSQLPLDEMTNSYYANQTFYCGWKIQLKMKMDDPIRKSLQKIDQESNKYIFQIWLNLGIGISINTLVLVIFIQFHIYLVFHFLLLTTNFELFTDFINKLNEAKNKCWPETIRRYIFKKYQSKQIESENSHTDTKTADNSCSE